MGEQTQNDYKAEYMRRYRRNPINQYKQKMYEINYWKRKFRAANRELQALKEVSGHEDDN